MVLGAGQGAKIKISAVRCHYLLCSARQYQQSIKYFAIYKEKINCVPSASLTKFWEILTIISATYNIHILSIYYIILLDRLSWLESKHQIRIWAEFWSQKATSVNNSGKLRLFKNFCSHLVSQFGILEEFMEQAVCTNSVRISVEL